MSLDRIYDHIFKMEKRKYYVDLAQNEIMLIPVLIDCLEDNCMIEYWVEEVLRAISEQHPELVYPYFDYIVRLMNKNSGVTLCQLWRMVTNMLVCDTANKWSGIRDKYYELLMSKNIAEFSVACDCSVDIVKVYPEEEKPIREVLDSVASREFKSGDASTEALRKVSSEKASEALAILNSKQ